MADPRWERIEQLYHEALARPGSQRAAWLAEACGDGGIRDEVLALLRFDAGSGQLLDRPALAVAAAALGPMPPGALIGQRLGGYEVLAFLGAGGMADVYRARDLRLGREVALKVFEHCASPAAMHRFEAEARAASSLNHPNIVTIYGVGEAGEVAYIAMELVRGETLRAWLSAARHPPAEALGVAIQLADGIAAAHACGIVHRDLKPENVMLLPDRRLKILDFGIAKLQHELWSGGESDQGAGVSETGAVMGTAAYMAPEQARGGSVDAASDQFSFGLICAEMLTGANPVGRPTREATLQAIADPAPLPALADGFGPFGAVIDRCLAKDPRARHAGIAEAALALRAIRDAREESGGGRISRRQALRLAGVGGIGLVAAFAAWPMVRDATAGTVLLILPFGNPTGDAGTAYLCDGVAETLIRQLGATQGVRVVPRATAFTFREAARDPTDIGRQLGVDLVLAGSLTRRAGRVRVSAELIDPVARTRTWGGEFDRPAVDVLAIQHELAESIIREALGRSIRTGERQRLTQSLTADPAAFDLFLRAVHHLRLGTEDDYLESRDLLQEAVTRDPGFALGFVTLASTYSVMAVDGYARPSDAWRESERHVNRALAIDPDLPDAHAEAAIMAFYYLWDWPEAERRWRQALTSRRGEIQSELLSAYALQKWAAGQPADALELARAARQADPLSAVAGLQEADLLAFMARLDDAVSVYEALIRDRPDDPRAFFGLAEARRRQGRPAEALAARERAHRLAGDEALEDLFAGASGVAGYDAIVRAAARHQLDWLADRDEAGAYVSPLDLARSHALLDEAGPAFTYLDRALEERAPGVVLLRVDPAWDGLRTDPRFAAAVARVGW